MKRDVKSDETPQGMSSPPDAPSPSFDIRHSTFDTRFSRRQMLKLLGASAALAMGLPGCKRKPHREIVSRAELGGLGGQSGVANPQLPGQVYHYASTWTDGPYPYGMLVKTVDGRPIKIDGNPDHPINRGASSPAMQASILSLYDPDRLKGPLRRGKPVTWAQADEEIIAALKKAKSVVVMTRSNLAGSAEMQLLDEFVGAVPGARRFVHEVVHDGPARRAWKDIYPDCAGIVPQLNRVQTIVSFDCDFLGNDGPALENIRRFTARRDVEGNTTGQNVSRKALASWFSRFYAIESAVTATTARADHRIRMKPSAMADFTLALCDLVSNSNQENVNKGEIRSMAGRFGVDPATLFALASDLFAPAAVVVAGSHLPTRVHAAVAALNSFSENNERLDQVDSSSEDVDDPREIEAALSEGVDVLILLGVNPVYDWSGGAAFSEFISRAGLTIGHGWYLDETLASCTMALPSSHNLESWGDAQWREGIRSLRQPVIAPLYDTRQEAESLLRWARPFAGANTLTAQATDWHSYLRLVWSDVLPTNPLAIAAPIPATVSVTRPATTRPEDRKPPTPQDLAWQQALLIGGLFNPGPETDNLGRVPNPVMPDEAKAVELSKSNPQSEIRNPKSGYELVILPHHAIYDGRFANNAWLQELPHPITRAVWGNFATISPATATQLGVVEGDVVRVTVVDRSVELPVLIQPGTADGVIVTTLGHGRTAGGAVALEAGGVNVAPLLGRENPDAPRVAFNAQVVKVEHPDVSALRGRRNPGDADTDYRIRPLGEANRFPPVRTQREFSQHGRAIALAGTLAEYRADPGFVRHLRHLPKKIDTFSSPYDYAKGHKWAMAVDLSACVGCGACVIACQAENNIPVVGRDQCDIGRNMHWLRIDCYRDGRDPANPAFRFQPMLCQQCDTAPCETVCPVNATAHSPEGINEMTYNRCVGTRYCQNNCPYKVRRFNFVRWHQFRLREATQELMFNPQVSVRSVGVMEKCTFCIQRINEAKFRAFNEGRKIADGEIQTACQQTCPAGAIVFGDANDPASRVAKLRASPRAYGVLEELNTKPNVTYLAKISNPAVEGEPTK